MPPRKNKKQRRDQDEEDEEIDQREQRGKRNQHGSKPTNSKWAHLLDQAEEEEEDAPVKQAYNYDFSQQHRLYNQKETVRKEESKVVLTPEQQEELARRLENQKMEKEKKNKVKSEKRVEKQKELEKEKEEEKVQKDQDERELKEIQASGKGSSDSKKIILTMLAVLLLLGLLNYQREIYSRLSKFKITSSVDYYEVFEISNSISDSELKNQYKKLVMKYHPDKNPQCQTCQDKFTSVMDAWEVLGNPEKRKSYDESSGFITQIPSATVTLTPDNYQWLLGHSDSIWLVQVYDSTNQYCHFFASIWEEFADKYKGYIQTGRIDVWQQSEMKSYIPYRFQLFPGLYTMYRGGETMCQLDFERTFRSLQLCIEALVKETVSVTKIKQWTEIPASESKVAVVLGNNIRLSMTEKLIHSSLSEYMDFYTLTTEKSSMVQIQGREHVFNLTLGTKKTIYKQYRQFLEGNILQKKSECEILNQCRDRPCLLLLNDEYSHTQLLPLPLIEVTDKASFREKIAHIKNITGFEEQVDLGYYQDGKIELGYFNEIDELNPENGEGINFICREETYLAKAVKAYDYLSQLLAGKP